jgi:hypothetical protein
MELFYDSNRIVNLSTILMKARSRELVDKGVAAMISAIEVYNKPDFKYREETFSILAINAWELLLKAKWLQDNNNRLRSLYVMEKRLKSDGKPYKHLKMKLTESGNPFTHSLEFVAKKHLDKGTLPDAAYRNLRTLAEIRDSSVHFYNRSNLFAIRLQEVGSAAVKNFVRASQSWFRVDLAKYNFYLMPLAFVSHKKMHGIALTREEKNVAEFIAAQELAAASTEDYAVAVNIEVVFSRSKTSDALKVQISNDPNAPRLQLSEEQLKDKYPLNYTSLTQECQTRYSDFLANQKYHDLRTPLKADKKYCLIRRLDPDNPRSAKQEWFSRAVFTELDKHYAKQS